MKQTIKMYESGTITEHEAINRLIQEGPTTDISEDWLEIIKEKAQNPPDNINQMKTTGSEIDLWQWMEGIWKWHDYFNPEINHENT